MKAGGCTRDDRTMDDRTKKAGREKREERRGILFLVSRPSSLVLHPSFLMVVFLLLVFFFPRNVFAQAPTDAGCAQEYEKLKKEHETLRADYSNVLAQAKALLFYKNKVRDMEDAFRQSDVAAQQFTKEKEALANELTELKEALRRCDANIVALTQERDDYKKSFEKASVDNIIGAEAKNKIADLETENGSLANKILELEEKQRAIGQEMLRSEATAELSKRQLTELRDKYEESRKHNKGLEKKLEDLPKNFAELARENKILIKRTSVMHYNLGVFYTQNREFDRAVAEFEKAVELNPEDSGSYFNLGYIYAEHLQNRSKAVSYFKNFLRLAHADDKDVDWVKRYILTWQTWEGATAVK